MKARIANKIYNAVAAYKTFETTRQPYSPEQQRKAIKAMRIPLHLRHMIRVCNKVKDPKRDCNHFLHRVVYRGYAATGIMRCDYTGSTLAYNEQTM